MEICNTFWLGTLGPLERACLRSMLHQGHSVRLWCYETPDGVPEGVELADAEGILPRTDLIFHSSGSVALFANRFRYELQRRSLGLWVDCDVYLVKPLGDLPAQVLGRVDENEINTAVLKLPPNSPILEPLLTLFDDCQVPPWLPWRARSAAWMRLLTSGRSGLSKMPWGSAGPRAVTWLARRYGVDREAMPPAHFYPRHWKDAAWILDPQFTLEDVCLPETLAVHLWNELIKGFKEKPAPPGSFLARLHREGA